MTRNPMARIIAPHRAFPSIIQSFEYLIPIEYCFCNYIDNTDDTVKNQDNKLPIYESSGNSSSSTLTWAEKETEYLGRKEGFPSRYSTNETPVTVDVTEVIFIALFLIIGIAYLIIIPSYNKRQSIFMGVKVTFSVTIGCLLIVNNFGQEWERSTVRTKVPYRAGTGHEINGTIGVKIGLRSVNITLKGTGEQGTPLAKETINYNERFWWTWDQGRFGFGPDAGLLQRNFRSAQRRGAPISILWVAEYFVIDGEGIRFGRFYRTAGWYCHILLWTAFATWILANIFLQSVGRYAAYCLGITGLLQILTCFVWLLVRNPSPLVIPFEDGSIRLHFGPHFWMTLVCGKLCVLLASILLYMDFKYPNLLSMFLNTNPFNQYDECIVDYSEYEHMTNTEQSGGIEMRPLRSTSRSSRLDVMVLKRRTSTKSVKNVLRCPVPVNVETQEEGEAIYLNLIRESISPEVITHRGGDDAESPPLVKLPEKITDQRVMV
ncbi:dual oxidase maturation factor 1-like isoform X1 [Nomia melanderi]|uniref:dual oxidase maturation factor 1-like isoform X1 n=2 Tax=Nomia melanderi TaxID=2448451 RepID=UPI003FCC335A